MIKPADFFTPIDGITAENLMALFIETIEAENVPRSDRDQEIMKLYTAISGAAYCDDHGFPHSLKVFNRSLQCLDGCPNLVRLMYHNNTREKTVCELTWASILHDLYRFMGCDLDSHQAIGALTARRLFKKKHPKEAENIHNMLVQHDYLCPLVDGRPLPPVLLDNPIAEIFRLADKTSVSPEEEINRYYLTGKRLTKEQSVGTFYNPDITFEERIDFKNSLQKKEFLPFFLALFAIQPADFFFAETAELYRRWALGKSKAARRIIELGHQEGLDRRSLDQIMVTIARFHNETLRIVSPFSLFDQSFFPF